MAIDWALVGTAAAGLLSGIGGWFMGRNKREAENAIVGAESELYSTLRKEISALHDEIVRLRRYVGRLERALRDGGLELPALDEPVGGTD